MNDRFDGLDLSVYVILDPTVLSDIDTLPEVTHSLVDAGCKIFQLRDKHSTARQLVDRARMLGAITRPAGALLLINDRVDVALAAGADGVHVGPHDISVSEIRRLAPELIVGGSAGSAEMASRLEASGAHYLGAGAVYEARAMKADASAPRGAAFIRQVTDAVEIPVFGIGGISAQNAGAVATAGARGVAVIRDVVASDNPANAYLAIRHAVHEALDR